MNILHLINDLSVGSIEKSLINYCINDKKIILKNGIYLEIIVKKISKIIFL